MKPTEEQTKRLWERCRLRKDGNFWYDPKGKQLSEELLPLDLNNLFRWAMPKLDHKYAYVLMQDSICHEDEEFWACEIYKSCLLSWQTGERIVTVDDKDPALALFWAIYKVMEGK